MERCRNAVDGQDLSVGQRAFMFEVLIDKTYRFCIELSSPRYLRARAVRPRSFEEMVAEVVESVTFVASKVVQSRRQLERDNGSGWSSGPGAG